ncbi:thioredoxin family protein [Pelomonas sp. CA6]|uniref:thioredoxin family protein n=1 Tax=Pelomonas sp. CA6 TaxID=2907999 RepID=UPI001F4C0528|nr:thioredoxin family protein [Pelomonas sp. CA6]MCH7344558.1 thioredoxin family protein [Pelomonas sp. CA6]
MNPRRFALLAAAALVALPAAAQTAPAAAPTQAAPAASQAAVHAPYGEHADARAQLNEALARAGAQRKPLLVVYGANWCKDCLALDRSFHQGRLATEIEQRYVVLKVNVGRFDRNVDLAQQMGVPLKKGIPTVALLAGDGRVLGSTQGGELANARGMGEDAVLQVLAKLAAH